MTHPAPRHEAIATRLREEILRGIYRPGDRLPGERDLAARLGVNRGSVREGLRQLEQDGLVEVRHGGGATVRDLEDASLGVVRHMLFVDGHLDAALLEQLLDVHEMLISGAARLTVERAEEDELARARELLSVLASARSSDDEFMDAIERLLDLIARGSRNLVLRLARNAIDPLFEPRFREARRRFRPPAELIEPIARELGRAITERDAPAAEEAVRQLLRANRERARGALRALYDAATPEARPQMEESHGQ